MNSYEIKLSYTDRTNENAEKTVTVEASSIAGAIGKASREFVAGLDRKQRFDANKGLRIEAARVANDKAEESGDEAESNSAKGAGA